MKKYILGAHDYLQFSTKKGGNQPPSDSVVGEDCNLTITLLTRSEVIAQVVIVGCLPVNHNVGGNITIHITGILLSEVCGGFIPTTETLVASLNVRNATHFTDQGINGIVTDCLTTTNIFFVVCNEVVLIVGVDELQHVIQSIVLLQKFINFLNSIGAEGFFVVHGESDGHWLVSQERM